MPSLSHAGVVLASTIVLAVPRPWLTMVCLECGHYGGVVDGGVRLLTTLFSGIASMSCSLVSRLHGVSCTYIDLVCEGDKGMASWFVEVAILALNIVKPENVRLCSKDTCRTVERR